MPARSRGENGVFESKNFGYPGPASRPRPGAAPAAGPAGGPAPAPRPGSCASAVVIVNTAAAKTATATLGTRLLCDPFRWEANRLFQYLPSRASIREASRQLRADAVRHHT